MSEKKLTPKQKVFCDEYIKTLNSTQSAIKAGYSKNSARTIASKLLTKDNIKDYINQRLEKKEDKRIASQDEVLEKITEVLRDDEAKKGDILKACDLMGKRYALFTEKIEHSGSVDIKLEDYFK